VVLLGSRPRGLQKVCELLRDSLKDEVFIAGTLTDVPERKVLREDPEDRTS